MTSMYDMKTEEDLEMGLLVRSALIAESNKAFAKYTNCVLVNGVDSVSSNIARELWLSLENRLENLRHILLALNNDLGGGPLGL